MPNDVTTNDRSRRDLAALGRGIVQALVPAENAIDAAIADGGALLTTVTRSRVSSGNGVEIGHDAILTILNCLHSLVTARSQIIDSHRQLSFVRDDAGLDPATLGCSATKRVIGSRRAHALATS